LPLFFSLFSAGFGASFFSAFPFFSSGFGSAFGSAFGLSSCFAPFFYAFGGSALTASGSCFSSCFVSFFDSNSGAFASSFLREAAFLGAFSTSAGLALFLRAAFYAGFLAAVLLSFLEPVCFLLVYSAGASYLIASCFRAGAC
jgi:hypothetical protein